MGHPAGKDLLTEAAISGFEEAKMFRGGKAKVAKHVSCQKFWLGMFSGNEIY